MKTSRIYEILDNLNLSHQKAHRDYDNADPEKQKKFVKVLKKNAPEKAWRENSIQHIYNLIPRYSGGKGVFDRHRSLACITSDRSPAQTIEFQLRTTQIPIVDMDRSHLYSTGWVIVDTDDG